MNNRIRRHAFVSATVILSALLTFSFPTAADAKTISRSAASAHYLAAAKKVNAAFGKFATEVGKWKEKTTDAQAAAEAKPAILALKIFDTSMIDENWPKNTVTDIHTLVSDDAAVIGDLESLATLNFLNLSNWESTFNRDSSLLSSAVTFVRHDLGLPPA